MGFTFFGLGGNGFRPVIYHDNTACRRTQEQGIFESGRLTAGRYL
ncbi:hypothetical protein D3OALGA1CA_5587 [Olavius algarvensis associated proteobacterium Delta 3]|nr:hypothetical protein D3OALGB2SA_5400 [Olavius algarvensis associated proteobacterium Delta 3]CAB5168857.1 hypothetical protein D3OALGA1CA_5587 [Olavius algarvensis associated proteobacterium Delta 3]